MHKRRISPYVVVVLLLISPPPPPPRTIAPHPLRFATAAAHTHTRSPPGFDCHYSGSFNGSIDVRLFNAVLLPVDGGDAPLGGIFAVVTRELGINIAHICM